MREGIICGFNFLFMFMFSLFCWSRCILYWYVVVADHERKGENFTSKWCLLRRRVRGNDKNGGEKDCSIWSWKHIFSLDKLFLVAGTWWNNNDGGGEAIEEQDTRSKAEKNEIKNHAFHFMIVLTNLLFTYIYSCLSFDLLWFS